ncbi:MAG TPA: phosphatase PAP2 family protein [Candidatus Saccharimonadales bacterium]|nr:phosphatase PAP2 family protein [Candidatus Saccharimonadales bacterium]
MKPRFLVMMSLFMALGFPLSADVITEWNSLHLAAIRTESTSPPLAARNLAMMHAAIYDAVNSINAAFNPYRGTAPAPGGALPEAAAVEASYACLSELYPSQIAFFQSAYQNYLTNTPASQAREDGLWVGDWCAYDVLNWRSSDGSSTSVPYVPHSEPGQWRRTAPFFRPPELPQWPYVIPFAMTNGAQFRPPAPPSLNSLRYASDVNLTKSLGGLNSTNRTPEQTSIARFWSDFSYTVTPPGHWNQIAQNVVTNRNSSLLENSRLFALLNIAMADAGIVAWDAKYSYNLWRPITAIQQADTDDNPDTEVDPEWTPLLNTPAFPEYISGHSIFSSAAATVLANFYGTDEISFTVGSDTLPTVTRSYSSFQRAAEEIGMSRIYGGIHFLSADLDGLETGHNLARYVLANFLTPPGGPATLSISQTSSRKCQINVVGTSGKRYVLQTSTNLLNWKSVLTNEAPFALDEQNESNEPARFYRAQRVE